MRKNPGSILYIFIHAAVFAALFLPPVWIPNHRIGYGDYHMALVFVVVPVVTAVTAIIAAAIPRLKWEVRLVAAAMLGLIGIPALYFAFGGIAALRLVLVYGALYALCFFAVRGLIRITRSALADYRGYLARHRGK